MSFGENLFTLLTERNITQSAFAKAVDINASQLNQYIKGKKPSVEFIYKVMEYFPDVDLNWLFDRKTDFVKEPELVYSKNPEHFIREIRYQLDLLEKNLSQK